MLSFAVFDHANEGLGGAEIGVALAGSGASGDWPLRHAHLFGPDDVPMQGDIRMAGQIIQCEKRGQESAGLSLQFPIVRDFGAGGGGGAARSNGAVPGTGGAKSISLVTLQTCLLPERERPYLLSLELARHRLMLVLNKLEDWALFDLPADDPGIALFERARKAFTEALVAHAFSLPASSKVPHVGPYSQESDYLARQALALAVEASEVLALSHAKVLFGRRISGELAAAAAKVATPANAITDHEAAQSRAALIGSVGVILPTPPQVGCRVNPEAFTPALQKAVAQTCDFVGMPMRWVDMEPTEGKYLFGKTDRWIEWAVRSARLPVVGGPIVDFRRGCVPEWLYIWEHDYETLRELVYEHVKTLVTRYRRTVGTWTVCSGLHVSSNFTLSFEQAMDLTRLVVMVVRKLQPSAKVQIQIDQPWGEYYASGPRSIPPMMYAESVCQAGINPDLFSVRVEMGQPDHGLATRDVMLVSAILDRIAALEKPIALTLAAPSRAPDSTDMGLRREFDPGFWRHPWSEAVQAQWLTAVAGIAASKPYLHSICWEELYELPPMAGAAIGARAQREEADEDADEGDTPGDGVPAIGAGAGGGAARRERRHVPAVVGAGLGLIDAAGKPKPALWRLGEIRQAIREKRSPLGLGDVPVVGSL